MQKSSTRRRFTEPSCVRSGAAAIALLVLGATNASQEQTPLPGLVNGDMESVDAEQKLVGWRVPATLLEGGYEIGPERQDVHAGALAARIDSRAVEPGSSLFGNLSQAFDAQPWQGKRVRYRAAVKVPEASSGGRAQLWLRVDLTPQGNAPRTGFFDNMDARPITSEAWQTYEIVGDVAVDAQTVVLGVLAIGQCLVLIDEASVEEVTSDVMPTSSTKAMDGDAPSQPFWTAWLWLPLVALVLFVLGYHGRGRTGLFALRFAAAYWVLYTLPDMLGFLVPFVGTEWKMALEGGPIDGVVRWAARAWLGIEQPLVSPLNNGSGDTTFAFVQAFVTFALALGAAGLWSLADRRVLVPARLQDLLRSWVRYYLAGFMVVYGTIKLGAFSNQFPEPWTGQLQRSYGDSSPMGLLWTFMASSRAFTYFAGASELLGGFLLLWRRTALLGALVSAGVMLNVMMMNFCFDVPVKLFSAHLVVAAGFVLLPELSRLTRLFLGVGAGSPSTLVYPFTGRAGTWTHRAAKVWFPWAVCFLPAYRMWKAEREMSGVQPLLREWKLAELELTGEPLTPESGEVEALTLTRWQMTSDGDGWKIVADAKLVGGTGATPTVHIAGERLNFEIAGTPESLILTGEFTWRVAGHELHLDSPEVRATFRSAIHEFLLMKRGFRWINEHPFNR